ncbi:MAG TPA: MG2 domain-containing protein [Gemmatimonadaceae bacterium]|nr:MG2 domain-containing protein [Gemmatimonadaceae bacterium]
MLLPLTALVLAAAAVVRTEDSLAVLRAAPSGTAPAGAAVYVFFDRPVAPTLAMTPEVRRAFRIEPAVPGRLAWRDPMTLRFIPDSLLEAGAGYAVSVAAGLRAADGSRLASEYGWSFRVEPPRLVGGSPSRYAWQAGFLDPVSPHVDLVWSAPVDAAALAAHATLEFNAACAGGARVVRLRALSQTPVPESEEEREAWRGASPRERSAHARQRVVRLVPTAKLPAGCTGQLVVPNALEQYAAAPTTVRWGVRAPGAPELAGVGCSVTGRFCPAGPPFIAFRAPVRGGDVLRHVRFTPAVELGVRDTAELVDTVRLEAVLRPNTRYVVTVDSAMRDAFGRPMRGPRADTLTTTHYYSAVAYHGGFQTLRPDGALPVRHVNVDTLVVTAWRIPDSLGVLLAPRGYRYGQHYGEDPRPRLFDSLHIRADTIRVAVRNPPDEPTVTPLRLPIAARPGHSLIALRIDAAGRRRPTPAEVRDSLRALREAARPRRAPGQPPRLPTVQVTAREGIPSEQPLAVVQRTGLAVHAKVGRGGAVLVTGLDDGRPRAGAAVTVFDARGRRVASGGAGADGVAALRPSLGPPDPDSAAGGAVPVWYYGWGGYVAATLGADRVVAPMSSDQTLDAGSLGGRDATYWWSEMSAGDGGDDATGVLFTERGVYRPGETVHAKVIARRGTLGALRATAGDSVRWTLASDDEGETLLDTAGVLSRYGTASQSVAIPASADPGSYQLAVQLKGPRGWQPLGSEMVRVAEYRVPEHAVALEGDTAAPHFDGDTLRATVAARYLFGAPVARRPVVWGATRRTLWPWELRIPGAEGFAVGSTSWWDRTEQDSADGEVVPDRQDTLDAAGRRELRAPAGRGSTGLPGLVELHASVADVNRQTVASGMSFVVHPAAFYVAARPRTRSYFWQAGRPQEVEVVAVRPAGGARVPGVRVRAALVRQEWRYRRRENGTGYDVSRTADTVARCEVVTAAEPRPCALTPAAGGAYTVLLAAEDSAGRRARTSFARYVAGGPRPPWVPDETVRLNVFADREEYAPGDTAAVAFTSPFPEAEAWVTLEREGIVEQRRLRVRAGETRLEFALGERHAPNVFASVYLVRSTPDGAAAADSSRPAFRAGYAELRVSPSPKRLAVEVATGAAEYRPGDSADVRVRVRDARGAGVRAEVALWAVDEGVLSLTGYRTPDPLAELYAGRPGLRLRLTTSLLTLAERVPPPVREPEYGGTTVAVLGSAWAVSAMTIGQEVVQTLPVSTAEVEVALRSHFATTPFYVGALETDGDGRADVRVKLPDNVTTFRVMAVAVTEGDRYGGGEASLLATRPLVARPALPRALRRGDDLSAGVAVARRTPDTGAGSGEARVEAALRGPAALRTPAAQTIPLSRAAGEAAEARFGVRVSAGAVPGDSVAFRFVARAGGEGDAVELSVPVKPDYHPRAWVAAGTLREPSAQVDLALPEGTDPQRSTLTLSLGSSPLAVVAGAYEAMRVYPYWCSEQVASAARPLIALYRARPEGPRAAAYRGQIERAVSIVRRRQRGDGGIGFWAGDDWTSPWLSAYVGEVLLEARDAGVPVDSSTIDRLEEYFRNWLRAPHREDSWAWLVSRGDTAAFELGERVAAIDFLTRVGAADSLVANELTRLRGSAERLRWEDRVRLAELLARTRLGEEARALLEPAWRAVAVEGRRAVLRDTTVADAVWFRSTVRPLARLLTATLALDSTHALVAPLAEAVVHQARPGRWWWNTQDLGSAVGALAAVERLQRRAAAEAGPVVVRAPDGTVVLRRDAAAAGPFAAGDSAIPLGGLLRGGRLALRVERPGAGGRGRRGDAGAALYYALTVSEVPRAVPERPDEQGIAVERWYERLRTGAPAADAAEGELLRVRLRVTVTAERQFVVLDDALPGGLEAVDLTLRTTDTLAGAATAGADDGAEDGDGADPTASGFGRWFGGWWWVWDHMEIRDERVVWSARWLPRGVYEASYVARATTAGTFVRPPAHAEEMYNPAVHGRSDGGTFVVRGKGP